MSQLFTNNATTVLATAKAAGATTMVVQAGTGARFPAPTGGDFFELTLFKIVDGLEAAYEIVKVTARSIDTFTIIGAQQGTAPTAFGVGDQVSLRVTASWLNKATTDIESKAPIASPTFTGTPAVPGAPNYIKGSTQIANVNYVLGMGFRYGLGTSITANKTMAVGEAGTWFQVNAGGLTVTLPTIGAMGAFHSGGATFTFVANAADFTLAGNGATVQQLDGSNAATMTVLKGECVTVQFNEGAVWYVLNHSSSRATNATYFAPINSPTFTGTPSSVAPTRFDSSNRIATTKFAMDIGLRFSSPGIGVGPGGNITVNASHAGAWFQTFNTGNLFVPAMADSWIGTAIGISAVDGGTLNFAGGCVLSGGNSPVYTYFLSPGETGIFMYNGGGTWYQTASGVARNSMPAVVKSSLTGYKNMVGLSANRAITAADIGALIYSYQADYAVTLPTPASIGAKAGDKIVFITVKGSPAQASIVLTPTGGALIFGQVSIPSLTVMTGQQVELVSDGASTWQIGMSTARMGDNVEIAAKAPTASPVFTGTPVVPTPALQANGVGIANTSWVNRRGAAFQPITGFALSGAYDFTASMLGHWGQFISAGCVLTIGAAFDNAAYTGATFTVKASFAGTVAFSGAGVVTPDAISPVASYQVKKGEVVTFTCNGTGWYVTAVGVYPAVMDATYAPINNPVFTGTVAGISKTMVGLANVDNTSDVNKPVSTAQQAAFDLKAPKANPTFTGTVSGIDKSMVGLGNVNNTADANKPVSAAQQAALDLKAALNGDVAQNFNAASVNDSFIGGMKNRIINGCFRINQRGLTASQAAPLSGYIIDRWSYDSSNSGKYSVGLNSYGWSKAPGHANYLAFGGLSSSAATAAERYVVQQVIEGSNIHDLQYGTAGAKTCTLSFWVRSTVVGSHSGAIYNPAVGASFPFSFSIPTANTWTLAKVTIPGDTVNAFDTGVNSGLYVRFNLGSGTNALGTAGAWQAGNFTGVTGSASSLLINAAIAFTGVQFEVGAATPFSYRSVSEELAMCQRYFETGVEPTMYIGTPAVYTDIAYGSILFKVTKRSAVSVTAVDWAYFSEGANTSFSPALYNGSAAGFSFQGFGLTRWNGWTGVGTWTANSEL